LIAWSRILAGKEVLVVINLHGTEGRGADVTIDAVLQADNASLNFLYRSDWELNSSTPIPTDQSASIHQSEGRFFIQIELPPSGMAILS
jgi:hypothetical protein